MNQTITMTNKELSRYEVIKKLVREEINGTAAAKQLSLSVRQIKRLKIKVRKHGVKGIIHGNRGRLSNRKISEDKINKIKEIIKEKYPDFGPTLAMEKLDEVHGIKISDEKVRHIMIEIGLWKPKQRKKNKEYRTWRQRKEQYGEMEQFDGSYHRWFENRAEECCLLASIDDATGRITKAEFADNESVISVFNFWKSYVDKNGKPISIYLDKYSTYKINHKNAVDNKELMTQFQRATTNLDIRLITAHSPEAKGRIERLFKTLQDRLIKEMRLRGISDKETANTFLEDEFIPWFNDRFGVVPAKKKDLHRDLTKIDKENLKSIFSVHSMRSISNDFTIRFKNKWFQLEQTQPTLVLRTDKVMIEERIDGEVCIRLRDKYLNYRVLPKRPEKAKDMKKVIALTRTKQSTWKPPLDHPWRKPFKVEKTKVEQLV